MSKEQPTLAEQPMSTPKPLPEEKKYYVYENGGPRVTDRQLAWAMLTMSTVAAILFAVLIVLTVTNN